MRWSWWNIFELFNHNSNGRILVPTELLIFTITPSYYIARSFQKRNIYQFRFLISTPVGMKITYMQKMGKSRIYRISPPYLSY